MTGATRTLHMPPWQKEEWTKQYGEKRPSSLAENAGGTRVFVTLTFDTQGDVDAAIPGTTGCWKSGDVNYADLTQRRYDTEAGVARVLNLLDEHRIKATFPTCGLTADWYPEVVDAIRERGHEVAVHGYSHALLHTLTDEELEEEVRAATDAIARAIGEKPAGWVSPVFSITPLAFRLVTREGYEWHSDFHDADAPYLVDFEDRTIVELPVGLNDWDLYLMNDVLGARMGGVPYASPSHVTDILTAQFDQLYRESERSPQVFHYCMHPKISGRPYRTAGLRSFLEHVQARDGVRFVTCSELASLCR